MDSSQVPGVHLLDPKLLVQPFTGDVSLLRSLDHLGQVAQVALNFLFVVALLSVLPTVSHCILAHARWRQPTFATTWLLTQVLDPVPFVIGLCRELVSFHQQRRAPVQKYRVLVVSFLFALIVGVEMVIIVGQASKETQVRLPISQFRMSPSPKVNILATAGNELAHFGSGSLIRSMPLDIPGTNAQARLVQSSWFKTLPPIGEVRNSSLDVDEQGNRPDRRNSTTTFSISTVRLEILPDHPSSASTGLQVMPVKVMNPSPSSWVIINSLSISGLFGQSIFAPFSWVDADDILRAMAVVADATGSAACDWKVSVTEKGAFLVYSEEPWCDRWITNDKQFSVVNLLNQLLLCRMRVGSFENDDAAKSLEFVTTLVTNSTKSADFGESGTPEITLTDELLSTRQVIPNTILIGMSCGFLLLSVVRSFCLGRDGRYVNLEYKVVAKALDWERNGTFARVNPDASSSSLPGEDGTKELDLPYSFQRGDHGDRLDDMH